MFRLRVWGFQPPLCCGQGLHCSLGLRHPGAVVPRPHPQTECELKGAESWALPPRFGFPEVRSRNPYFVIQSDLRTLSQLLKPWVMVSKPGWLPCPFTWLSSLRTGSSSVCDPMRVTKLNTICRLSHLLTPLARCSPKAGTGSLYSSLIHSLCHMVNTS